MADDMPTRSGATARGFLTPGSWNEKAGSVDVVFTTGAPLRRYDPFNGETYVEKLVVTSAAMDLTRLNAGAPVLDSHDLSRLDAIVGVVLPGSARIENGRGYATLVLSDDPRKASVREGVAAGIIRNVSVGGHVEEWAESREPDGTNVQTAVRWTP